MLAARVEGEVAAGGGGRGGLGEGQSGEQQGSDRKGDQERFTPPPPDRASAANARQARWVAVRESAAWFTGVTLHQRRACVIAALVAGSCLRRNDGEGVRG